MAAKAATHDKSRQWGFCGKEGASSQLSLATTRSCVDACRGWPPPPSRGQALSCVPHDRVPRSRKGTSKESRGNDGAGAAGETEITASCWSYPGKFAVTFKTEAGRTYALEVAPRQASVGTAVAFGAIGGAIDASVNENSGAFELKAASAKGT